MLEEQKIIDKIEVLENGTLQVREVTRILKDGEVVASTFHRWSFAPGSDITAQPLNVQNIAQVVWTEEALQAYINSIAVVPQ